MDDNCRPLEHFNFLQDVQQAENMQIPNQHSVHHPPGPIPSVLLLSQLLRRVKGKGSENTAMSTGRQSLNSQALTFKAQGDTWLTAWLGVLRIVIYLFCLLSYDILFSVCIKQDLEKQHNTSPHFYLFYFSYQNLGRRNYIFAQLLVNKCYKCYPIFDTVGYETRRWAADCPCLVDRFPQKGRNNWKFRISKHWCRKSFSTVWLFDHNLIAQILDL